MEFNEEQMEKLKIEYKPQLDALEATFKKFNVPSRYYRFFSILDQASCLLYEDGKWTTFFSERGHRGDEVQTTDIIVACHEMIYAMASDKDEYAQMIAFFENELQRNEES